MYKKIYIYLKNLINILMYAIFCPNFLIIINFIYIKIHKK